MQSVKSLFPLSSRLTTTLVSMKFPPFSTSEKHRSQTPIHHSPHQSTSTATTSVVPTQSCLPPRPTTCAARTSTVSRNRLRQALRSNCRQLRVVHLPPETSAGFAKQESRSPATFRFHATVARYRV